MLPAPPSSILYRIDLKSTMMLRLMHFQLQINIKNPARPSQPSCRATKQTETNKGSLCKHESGQYLLSQFTRCQGLWVSARSRKFCFEAVPLAQLWLY